MAKPAIAKDKAALEKAMTELARAFEKKHGASFRIVCVASRRIDEKTIEVFTEVEVKQ